MTTLKKISFLLLCTLLLFSACKKDQITDEEQIINPEPIILVNGSVSGLVLDILHQPVPDAKVRVGTYQVMSDQNGVFIFKDIQLNKAGTLVTAEKEGYFYNAKFVRPVLNKMSFTKFKLMEKTLTGTFESASGGTVSIDGENARITLPANGIKTESGDAYSGSVNVYATWIDPTGVDLLLEMPGDLRGMDLSEERVQLTSFGMIGVELEGSNGAALNLADGSMATIEMAIPNTLLENAPETIPLWHFNENTGMWIEEGEATLQDGKYVGTVGHFSFWNCDVPNDFIDLTGSVINEGGGIQHLLVKITDDSNGVSGFGYTDEDGFFNGFVPNDQVLTLTVFDDCGDALYSAQIGPFSSNTTLAPIVINNSITNNLTISGTLENCDMNGVTNGYVKVGFDNTFSIIPLDADGSFNSTINVCSSTTVSLIGYDIDNFKQSTLQVFDVTGINTLDVGVLTTCIDLVEYFNSTIGSQSFLYSDVSVTYAPVTNDVTISAEDLTNSMNGYILISVSGATEINTPYTPVTILGLIGDFTTEFADCNGIGCADEVVTFQSLDWTNPGDVIQGSYEGTMINPVTGNVINVSGSFRAVKD